MPFEALINEDDHLIKHSVKKDIKIIVPISMGQKYHTGQRLKALIELAKQYNVTILIADALHRYNLQDEKEALELGNKFLEKNEDLFEEAKLIQSVDDWEIYKEDSTILKIVRWNMWGQIKKSELELAHEVIEKECIKPDSTLIKKMEKTAEIKKSSLDAQNLKYQKEENKYLLTFSEFEYHIYPGSLNSSQAETYKLFNKEFKIPLHKSVKFEQVPLSKEDSIKRHQRHEQSLPFALRMMIKYVEEILKSSETPQEHKNLFIVCINNIFESIEIQKMKKNFEQVESFIKKPFYQEISTKADHIYKQGLPLILRISFNNIQELLESQEISQVHKNLFISKLYSFIVTIEHQQHEKINFQKPLASLHISESSFKKTPFQPLFASHAKANSEINKNSFFDNSSKSNNQLQT